jgi:AAA ATPase domain
MSAEVPRVRVSPFTPGQPVPFDYFVGRPSEVARLRAMADAAATGRLQIAFLRGERGIGKTSLAAYGRVSAENYQNMLGIHVFLGGVSVLDEMAKRVFDCILKSSADKPWYSKVADVFGSHIKKVSILELGVEFAPPHEELQRLVESFAPALRIVLKKLGDEKKGLFLVLDEIDDLARTKEFALWLKSLVDEIATSRDPLPLCVLLVGLESHRQEMIGAHESLARVFEIVDMKTWADAETRLFFEESFGKVGMAVDDDALTTLAVFAGGFPVLAQEIGDAAFKADKDSRIDKNDASAAVWSAAETVGTKLLEPQIYDAMRSPRYRSIFRRLARETDGINFKRKDVEKGLSADEKKVFDNFLRKMRDLGVIEPNKEGGLGAYRFKNVLHSMYFFMEARAAPGATTASGDAGQTEHGLVAGGEPRRSGEETPH